MKLVKIMIGLFSIIIVILCIIIFFNYTNQKDNNDLEENITNNTENQIKEEKNSKITEERFYTAIKCIDFYLGEDVIFVPNNIKWNEGIFVDKYLFEGYTVNNDYESKNNKYIYVKLDNSHKTFSIQELDTLNNNFENIEIDDKEEEIIEKDNNSFEDLIASNEDIVKKCFEYLKINLIANGNFIYKNMDNEYKEKKFKDENDFNNFIAKNLDRYKDMELIKYSKENENGNIKYTFEDNYNNNYSVTLLENNINCRILLDNYTIETDNFKQIYRNAKDEQKVFTNVDKFIKMLNNKDYQSAYEVLNNNFKNVNFDNVEKFEEYVKNNFYDYNILSSSANISKEGNYYTCIVELKSNMAVSAETMNKTFIIALGNDTDFTMSFEVN